MSNIVQSVIVLPNAALYYDTNLFDGNSEVYARRYHKTNKVSPKPYWPAVECRPPDRPPAALQTTTTDEDRHKRPLLVSPLPPYTMCKRDSNNDGKTQK